MNVVVGRAEARFWSKVEMTEACWSWGGSLNRDGYGTFRWEGHYLAHRWAYAHFVGPIPDGLTLDHLCRNRACVNPSHLEPVARGVNVLRGVGPTAANARKDACVNGHAFSDENTYLWRDRRGCRACRQAARARRKVA